MTEQEYRNVNDLQSCYVIVDILRKMNCFDNPNRTRRMSVIENIRLMIADLETTVNDCIQSESTND